MVIGSRKVVNSRTPCVVFANSRMDWIWTAQVLGFEPVIVYFRQHNALVRLVKRLLPRAEVIVGSYAKLKARALPSVAFVHGHAGSFDFLFEGVDVILSTQGKRGRLPEGWRLSKARTTHALVGGVTNSIDHCFLWSRGPTRPENLEVCVPRCLSRDVHSVVSDTVSGQPWAKPEASRLSHPKVLELTPGVYHGGGLLDVDHPNGSFLLRSVFTPTKWCRRRLTKTEIAMAFDIPSPIIQACTNVELELLIRHPSRALEHCAKSLMAHEGVINRGGKYVFATNTATTPVAVRAKEAEGGVRDEPRRETDERFRVTEEEKEDRNDVEFDKIPVTVEEEDPEMVPMAVEPEEPEKQRDKADTDRDLKAAKADDAEAPIWLWNDAIRDGLMEDPVDRGHTVEAVDAALDAFRNFLLQKQCRLGVTRSFFIHIKIEHPELQASDRMEVRAHYEWEESKNPEKEAILRLKYRWRSKFGRSTYKAWWNGFWENTIKDKAPGRDAIWRIADSSWWEWDVGSAPIYWRWPPAYRDTIRDGLEIWFSGEKPQWRRPQRVEKNVEVKEQVIKKVAKVRKRQYISPGYVRSLTDFFSVPKGDSDIRMVYNGTSSGLNDVLWVPSFPLPTVNSVLRAVHPNSWMADTDLGEMFLNFVLHDSLRELAGVDVTHYRGAKETMENPDGVCWERWERCAMGLKPSPYQTTQAMLFAEDVIRGNPNDPNNVFRWNNVRLNLPGSPEYDPTLPWTYKVRKDGTPACDFFFYVDDNRTTGNTEQEAWLAARRVASVCSYLGIQDATRKRRKASKTPGAWAGAVISTDDEGVYVSVSEEKWKKARDIVERTVKEIAEGDGWIGRKGLERSRGFLSYVTRTYPSMVPYMKGFHLTIDGWRKGRNDEGWKYLDREIREQIERGEYEDPEEPPEAPKQVKAKPRLVRCDLPALTRLFSLEKPPKRLVRARKFAEVYYGFGDASQDGFGFNLQEKDGDTIHFRYGQWSDEVSEKSSNYRELYNLVCRLEELVEDGTLQGCEVFIFTDNSTAESAFFKGNSSSEYLYDLVLRLRELEMRGDLILHMTHVAGTRVVEEGADGESRGDLSTGAMAGTPVVDYVPLHRDAVSLEPGVKQWLEKSWDTNRGELSFLTPNDWFTHGVTPKNCVWTPAPAAADAAAEQMARRIHQHPDSCHIFVAPRLMTARWRRRVGKLSDLDFEIGPGSSVWPTARHEPLLIYVCLPLSIHRPWKLRGTQLLEGFKSKLRNVHKTNSRHRGRLLRQLFVKTRRLESMPESMVRGMLRSAWDESFPNQNGRG
jgi:hypothetical protein